MRSFFSLLVSLSLICGAFFSTAAAQTQQTFAASELTLVDKDAPAILVSVRSANSVLDACDKTIDKINEPTFKFYTSVLRLYLSQKGPLGGFDLDRPFALIIDPHYGAAAIFPVQDWNSIKKNLTSNGGVLTNIEQNRYKYTNDSDEVFLSLQDKWLAVSPDPETAVLKAIPQPCLGAMERITEAYLAGCAVNLSRMTIQQLKDSVKGLQKQLEASLPLEGMLDGLFQLQLQALCKSVSQSVQRYQKDNLKFVLGINFDPEFGVRMDVILSARAETETAKLFNQFKRSQTHLLGFYNSEAAMSLSVSNLGRLALFDNPAGVESLKNTIEKYIEFANANPSDKDFKSIANELTTIFTQTLAESSNEIAITLRANPEQGATIVGAMFCKNGLDIEKQLFDLIKKEVLNGNKAMYTLYQGFKQNVAKVNDVKIHTITLPLPKETSNYKSWQRIFKNDKIVVAIGFRKDMVCWGVGAQSVEELKRSIENSAHPQNAPIFQYNTQYGTIIQFIEAYDLISKEEANKFAKFKKSLGKQFYQKCEKRSLLFFEQTASESAFRRQEEISFDAIKFIVKYLNWNEAKSKISVESR